MTMMDKSQIGLALSGGGVRAMAFHCGVLRWFAEQDQLEQVTHISSVSGGSLFAGLVFTINHLRWPTSQEYLTSVAYIIRIVLTETDLQSTGFKRLLLPQNWKFLLSRANVLAQTIKSLWGVTANLTDLPSSPAWSVNGTTAETGKRFRFKRTECGDYETGYAEAGDFSISDAMAVSAAFPVGIGPFVVKTSDLIWKKRKSWGSAPETAQRIIPQSNRLHIYDGGVYDNLGLEPLFDVGKCIFKSGVNHVVISDAGSPLKRSQPGSVLNPFRIKRITDIALDQTRALRIRPFVNFLQRNPSAGAYLQIGASPVARIQKYHDQNEEAASLLLKDKWLEVDSVDIAASYPTNLKRLTSDAFQLLEQHGYETAKWNALLFASS
jgi:NTE family protein